MSQPVYTQKLLAGSPFPKLSAIAENGESVERVVIRLSTPRLEKISAALPAWQLLVVYRGQHCPMCTEYLNALTTHVSELAEISIDVLAVSADSPAQLQAHLQRRDKHHLQSPAFPLACGLTSAQLHTLGCYISDPRSPQETDHRFAEPALFVINEHGGIQVVDYSNNPFVRPDLGNLLRGLKWIRNPKNNYPIRGTYAS